MLKKKEKRNNGKKIILVNFTLRLFLYSWSNEIIIFIYMNIQAGKIPNGPFTNTREIGIYTFVVVSSLWSSSSVSDCRLLG